MQGLRRKQFAVALCAAVVCCAAMSSSACLVRRRVVAPPPGKPAPNRSLITATKAELIRRIEHVYGPIESFTMKASMSPSVGQLYGGQVTDYATLTGFILFRRPDDIRVIGQDPVIHSELFDMVSTGNEFRVLLPVKNQFVEGTNDAPATSKNKLENLRPAAFLTSLLVPPPDPATDLTMMEDDTNEQKAVYILQIIRRNGDELQLMRNVYFDRYTLQINRQKTFDAYGNIKSDAKYSVWKQFNGLFFPTTIQLQRPQEGYELVLDVLDMKINTPDVTPEKFVLNQPPGVQVRMLSAGSAQAR